MICAGKYTMQFRNGGIEVLKDGSLLYYNKRPIYVLIKTALSITEFYDRAYEDISEAENQIIARGIIKSPTGSELAFIDTYEAIDSCFKVSRNVKVLKNVDDMGFASKIAFVMAASDNVRDYNCFAPANWYRQNEFTAPHVMGYDLDCEYFWRNEVTRCRVRW